MTQDIVGGSEVQQAAKRRSERSPAPTRGCRPFFHHNEACTYWLIYQ
ncbi:MAG: hypothetical protein J6T35_01500 [Bacteroidales bacterium]|nr:hypothetical protein [Bacteroidales bacterium]